MNITPQPPSHNNSRRQRHRFRKTGGRERGTERGRLKELLGHVGPATLVDDVGDHEDHLERNQQEDEEAHTWARGGNDYKMGEKQLAN